ncbi:hypothetical protein [Streptomyces narbonensis]|uniref:hypothetical protein n=1 Tax=Streptomyces narbonensis TaxID=67333 RepID=UPI00167ADC31|nr:hypothetical protein [Streptomyces narbonensis]GGV93538.1 hypothetical protein GCM10010230_04560 [Streptomyces narbonensis]
MSIIASIPVLKGEDHTNLSAIPEGLLLRSRHEQFNIPGEAVARVRAEGAAVAVELRAPAGATPVVYRIEGVDEAHAVAFADGVNSLLLEPDEEVDGLSLVVCDTRRTRRAQRAMRRLKRLSLAGLVATVVMAVVGGMTGGALYPVLTVPLMSFTVACLAGSQHELTDWLHRRRIRKHGAQEFARPANLPGSWLYVDATGLHRAVIHFGGGPYLEVAYDREDPADVVTLRPGFMQRLGLTAGVFLLFCGILGAAATVGLMVEAAAQS